jgi:dihydroxyacetone synthase
MATIPIAGDLNKDEAQVGSPKKEQTQTPAFKTLSKIDDLVLKTFRLLVADLCQQFKGGHPEYAIFA